MPMVGLGQRAARFEGLKAVTLTNYVIPPRALARIFFLQAEDCIRVRTVTGVQTCALPIFPATPGCLGTREEEGRTNGRAGGKWEGGRDDNPGAGGRRPPRCAPGAQIVAGARGVLRRREIGRASCRERV